MNGEALNLNYSVNDEICKLIIGYNQSWKQEVKLGKKNNQQFVNIPHYKLIEMLISRAKLRGIKVIITAESYASQSSCLYGENLPKYREKKHKFSEKKSNNRIV
ncbi:MAG: IS200/IS605 family element transposase accessory protein TnpB [Okeania sp. SIO3B3]|nr:IS200/IS605 family element transposase accessory protein TnpB [Okeania sp. SIO3B3]